MTAKAKAILQQALKLPKQNRAALAEELRKSVEQEEGVVEAAKEAHRRWQSYRRSEIGGKPAEEVLEKLRKRKRP